MRLFKPMRIRISIAGEVTEVLLKSGQALRFGTEPGWADIPLRTAVSSGREFVVRLLEGELVLEDMGSPAGVFVAGRKVRRAKLSGNATVHAAGVEIHIETQMDERPIERPAGPAAKDTTSPAALAPDRSSLVAGKAAAVIELPPQEPFSSRLRNFEEFRVEIASVRGLFAILDMARGMEVIKKVLTSKERCECLYDGEAAKSLRLRAPHLVELPPGSAFLQTLLAKGWGKSWGIYLSSPQPFEEVRRHFRHFLFVTLEDGAEVYFRFYDPRVLRAFLPTCEPAEIREFFGPIQVFWVEAESAGAAHVFSFQPTAAPPRKIVS